jgi:2'-5' RNA ligase
MANLWYFVGIGLPAKEEELFSFLKQEFDPKNHLTSPVHITLIPPFRFRDDKELAERIGDSINGLSEFKAVFEEFAVFRQPKYQTVYMAPKDDKEFTRLVDKITVKLPELKLKGQYVPHLTLANRVPEPKAGKILEQLKLMGLKLSLRVEGVTIYCRSEGESWQVFKRLHFKRAG